MPIFSYICSCGHTFDAMHKIGEPPTLCPKCGAETIKRTYSESFSRVEEQKAGKIVKEHIEEAKEEVRREREQLKKREA
jgi:putative FmdB family regulatory protein